MGEWKDNLKDGLGTYTFEKESEVVYYEGQWKNDKKSGKGTQVWKNGVKYVGEWKDGFQV